MIAGVTGALMNHSILSADTRGHLKAVATAAVLAVSLMVIAAHLSSRASGGDVQAQWTCWAMRSGTAEPGCRLRVPRPTRVSLATVRR